MVTMVTISIPVRRKSPLNEKATRNPGNVSSQTILVIDDEEGVREVLGKICQEEGYRVVLAETARQGLAEFNQSHFDLVLTDLAMPEMSGWDLAKRLKGIDPSVSVGLITGGSVVITKENTKKRGVDFIVSKPFDYINVLRKVNALLKSKKT